MTTRILIIDDDLEALRLISLMLERKGFETEVISSGAEGLVRAVETQPELIILDIMMPKIDGYAVAKKLRRNPRTSNIPILFFTAKSMLADKIAGFQVGGDDYLTKPIHPVELINRVKALLKRLPNSSENPTRESEIIAFLPVKGGTGNSTIALNTAISLNRTAADKKIILVECRNGNGSLALQVGNSTGVGIQNLLAQEPTLLTQELVEAQTIRYSQNLHILPAADCRACNSPPLTAKFVISLQAILAANYDYLLMDLPPSVAPPCSELLQKTDRILLTLAPDNITLKLAAKTVQRLRELNIKADKINLVLIQKARYATKITYEQLEAKLEQKIIGSISPAPELAQQSWNTEVPIVSRDPTNLFSQQIKMVSDNILKQD